MNVAKCNIRKKDTKGKFVSAGKGFIHRIELCYDCGSSIVKILRENGIIEKENYGKAKK